MNNFKSFRLMWRVLLSTSFITELSGQTINNPACLTPLGMQDNSITDSQLAVSSISAGKTKQKARYNCCAGEDNGAWCPAAGDKDPWYKITLKEAMSLGGFLFQHPAQKDKSTYPDTYMKTFDLQYISASDSQQQWRTYYTDIPSVYNSTTSYNIQLTPPVTVTAVRISPRTFLNAACIRFELLGCDPKVLCHANFCQNGGQCIGINTCKCQKAYYGDRCDKQATSLSYISVSFTQIIQQVVMTTSAIQLQIHGNVQLVDDTTKGKVIHLQGAGSYLVMNQSNLNSCIRDINTCSAGFTLTLNIKFSSLLNNTYIISSGGQVTGHSGVSLFYRNGKLNYYVKTNTQLWMVTVTHNLELNVWHKIELSWNKNLGTEILDNGVLIGSVSKPVPTQSPGAQTSPVYIGTGVGNPNTPINFQIAMLQIFDANRGVLVDNSIDPTTVKPMTTITTAVLKTTAPTPPTVIPTTKTPSTTPTKSYCDRQKSDLSFTGIQGNILYSPSYNFTVYQSPLLTPEKDGSAILQLTNTGQYVELPNIGLECIQDMTKCNNGFTLSVEINLHDITSTNKRYIFSSGGDRVKSSGIALYLWKGDLYCSAKKNRTIWIAKKKLNVKAEEWHTYQVSWNQIDGFIVYIDGNKFMDQTIRLPNPTQNDTHPLLIATSPGYSSTTLMDVRHLYTWSASRDHLIQAECIQEYSNSSTSETRTTVPTSTPAPASLGPGRSDIACEADSITSFVPVDQLPVGTQLTWRDPACGLTSNGTHLLSTIGHNQCGTTVKITQNSVEFENELIAQSTKSTQSLVDFGDSSFVIPVKCIYPRQTQVATFYQPTQQHVRFYEKRYGHFDVDIVQYKTDKFVTPVQDLGIPRKVPIKSQIYVEAGINDQYSSGLGIHVDQCIATRTPSPSDSVYYSLIKDGCPIIPHVTLYNSTNSKVRFGVEAFRFVTANASDVVYIHCQVSVCDAATPHCAVNCMTSAGRRRRAAAGSGDKTHLLSTGPFMLVVDDQATSLSSSNLVAAISALVAVIACIVAIIGWTRRRHEAVTQPNKL